VTVAIGYVDGPRFRRSLLAAADWVAAARDELNRINVFPVPDGDTGTNLCLTLRAVAHALRELGDAPLPRVSHAMAHASVRGAHGNSGLMFSQFLLGFREGLGEQARATSRELADAMQRGFTRLASALDEPVEGTILTVAREAAQEADSARHERDIKVFMQRVVRRAEEALARTPELLAVLRKAGVVDAGAKGFVRFLDGVKRMIEEGHIAAGAMERLIPSDAAASTAVMPERDFRYCTEVLVRGPALPGVPTVREALRPLGGSVVVLHTGDLLKAHVHTDTPDAVFATARAWGTLESTQVEDMRAQHAALGARRAIAFVTDTACDLDDAYIAEHRIGLVPLQLIVDGHAHKDRLEITAQDFFARLRTDVSATTSQPAPQDFTEVFEDATRTADHVIAVVLSRALSGTFANAEQAARDFAGRLTVVNGRSASLGQGLLVMRGVELAARGWAPAAIAAELERVRDQSGVYITIEDFDRLVRSGRLSRGRAWLGRALNMKPVLGLSRDGRLEPVARVRGSAAARRRILQLLDRALAARPRELRLAVVHADIPAFAEELRHELAATYHPKTCLVAPVTPVIAAHAGIGAWGIFFQIEDGTNS
jgi:DAK2 domain fusion protein YloV